ncbi:pyridine nucleotide-disulfide oxidoreductase-domain-containing protein [Crepidotus variabilis]|uniref:Pyridine nucleotide-disulfide oxidoreductase-domain-containing protein n=1 Tax=Crepidotus variabilis TaxID=179855 RepID=A0A9P6EA32_9AGAR|nr:pyridine nucleotide-disulfide oxidoreductase-domain-containing protein [Crepidotus variabilis]
MLTSHLSHRNFSVSIARSKQRVVILGSGWGGYNVLRGIDKKRWDVTVLSPNTFFNFTPLLAGTAVGTLEFRCAVEPVRKYTPEVTFYQAWCDDIDFSKKLLTCMPATKPVGTEEQVETSTTHKGEPFTIKYDKLVIAVGAYSQTFNVPGVKEHAHFLKDVTDAREIRSRILECFEQANQPTLSDVERRNLLHFCIVGGGPTGVEFSAELHDLLHTEIRKHYPHLAKFSKITLYDVAPNILGTFDKSLVKYTENTLSREGVNILTSHHVERVEKGKLFIKEQGEVPFGLLVWSTGLAPNPLVEVAQGVKKDKKTSSLLTNSHLNVLMDNGRPNHDVWAIGDASTIEDAARLPATAQVANQKAKYLVKKINKLAKDRDSPEPFEFHNAGSLAYIGNWKAVYDRPSNGSDEVFLTKETGRIAWLLWRSAYFTMTLSWRNNDLYFCNDPYTKTASGIFGRDLTRF